MSSVQARKAVLVSMVALLAIAYYRTAKGENEGSVYRRLWGTGVLFIFLSVLADFVPDIAGPFAGLTVLGSLTHGGDKALQNGVGKIGSGPRVAMQTTRQTTAAG